MSRLSNKIDIMIGCFEKDKNTKGRIIIHLVLAKLHAANKEYDKMLECFRAAAAARMNDGDYETAAKFFDSFILEVFEEYDKQ